MRSKKILMLSVAVLGVVIVALLGIRAASKRASQPAAAPQPPIALATTLRATPGDQRVIAAQMMIDRVPSDARGYNLLAAAFMQKARETGDFGFNAKAEEALARSVKAEPDNYDALKLRAKLLLTFHRFTEAYEVSLQAKNVNPRDHDVYGAMTDALVELGDYPKAVEAAQMMVDLRPDTASYSRVSYLRQLHGDTKGAIEAMRVAAQAASPQDPESVAWCLVQLGDALINDGQMADGERELDRALFTFPDYHLALAAKAHARLSAGDTGKAVEFYRRAIERVPLPEYAIALGDLYTKLGQTEEAKRQYALVEFVERAGANNNTYSRQLALFWADHDMRLDDALAAAERERAMRKDIYTADALAWCLYKKGRLTEAKTAIDEALRLGTRDARLLYHAGMISNGLGDRRAAAKSLKEALKINPSFDALQADVARKTVASMKA